MSIEKMFLAFVVILLPGVLSGQNSVDKIKESREKTLREIEYSNKLLLETQGKTKESLNEINIINHRLAKRKEYLIGLEVEVNVLQGAIEGNIQDIGKANLEINKIKRVYAQMITNLYKKKSTHFRAMYLIASENLNQLYKRIHTVKLYNKYLRKERDRLESLRSEMEENNRELEKLRNDKDAMVNRTKSETLVIQREMNEKNRLVRQLKQKQKEIEQDIRNKEKTAKKLEAELKKIINEERKLAKGKTGKESLTPADRIVSTDFEKNTGKLPWPTQKGIITGKYGEHQHPDYKHVTVRNDGVYISTSVGESARTIFKGVVSRVFAIPGENFTVIIKHGQYFSLYHNLVNVKVKPGQSVNTKELIGTVFTDNTTKETILYFQIWKETEKSDPEIWLAPL